MKQKFRILCKKCRKFYLPDDTKISKLGYCEDCRFVKGRCKVITQLGYQCQNERKFAGYCLEHFLTRNSKDLVKEIKNR